MGTQLPLPQFSAHICCSQMAGWINMPLGMAVGLSPGDFVLDWDPALPSPKMGGEPPPQFSAHFYCGQTAAIPLHASRCHLVWRYRPQPRGLCVRWGPSPRKFSPHVYYSYCDFVIECSSSSSSTLCILI